MIESLLHRGKYVDDTTIEGERRADGIAPAHANGLQVSRNRFLLTVSMLNFRGVDDNTSAIWQLREGSYDGPVVKEGVLVKSIDDWYPLGDTYRCVRQYGHPVVLGVPKGAVVRGRRAVNENVFAVAWRTCGRVFVPTSERVGGYLMWFNEPKEVRRGTQCVEWAQFRLADDENDIEFIQPPMQLRQVGYEDGEQVCPHPGVMNQSYVAPVAVNDDATEWAMVNTLSTEDRPACVAALRLRYDAKRGRYDYVQTGPLSDPGLFEGNISRYGDSFVLNARRAERKPGVAWARVSDPFTEKPAFTLDESVGNGSSPLSAYRAADGVIRLLSGDERCSQHRYNRDPIFLWDIDPDNNFAASNRRSVYSPRSEGTRIPHEHGPIADMAKLLPHAGGRIQKLIHRVRTCAMAVKEADYGGPPHQLTEDDFIDTAVYHADMTYTEEQPASWRF